jgi:hypothetical protein
VLWELLEQIAPLLLFGWLSVRFTRDPSYAKYMSLVRYRLTLEII